MRIAFMKKQKALDINLHLNDNSSSKTSEVYKQINQRLKNANLLYNEHGSNDGNFIPDDATIVRHEIAKPLEELKGKLLPEGSRYLTGEAREQYDALQKKDFVKNRNVMKNASRSDYFIAMDYADDIMAVINDYRVVWRSERFDREQNDNCTRVLKFANYFLHLKPEEMSNEKSVSREKLRNETPEIDRAFNKQRKKEKFNEAYKSFKKLLEEQKSKNHVSQVDYDKLEVGDRVSGRKSGTNIMEITKIISKNEYGVTLEYINEDSENQTPRKANFGRWDDLYEVDEELFYEVPEINWKAMILKQQHFPKNLFTGLRRHNDFSRYWNDMVRQIKHDESEERDAKSRQQRKIENREYITSNYDNLKYRDKSGYIVDLGKYFDTMKQMQVGVPKPVTDKYKEIFEYMQTKEREIAEKTKQFASEEKWFLVEKFAEFIRRYNTKKFNAQVENLINEEAYDSMYNPMTQGRALMRLQENLEQFNKRLEHLVMIEREALEQSEEER